MAPNSMEKKTAPGYGKPPWIFKGSALYQLHLVKSELARAFIPKEFRLVEAFGYTLGGFFLASYEDSPAGAFDELVVMAGIVWDAPTSCAWAARVFVNSDDACRHGRKEVGLPSQVARFSKKSPLIRTQQTSKARCFLNMIGVGATYGIPDPESGMDVQVTEIAGPTATDICRISIATNVSEQNQGLWMGPAIKMSLPSFSGRTVFNPDLLRYSCKMECRVRTVRPAKISRLSQCKEHYLDRENHNTMNCNNQESLDEDQNLSISIMLSKPILALEFHCLNMQVEAPIVVSRTSVNSAQVV